MKNVMRWQLAVSVAAAGVAHAYHGWSEYDSAKALKGAGVITCGRLLAYV